MHQHMCSLDHVCLVCHVSHKCPLAIREHQLLVAHDHAPCVVMGFTSSWRLNVEGGTREEAKSLSTLRRSPPGQTVEVLITS